MLLFPSFGVLVSLSAVLHAAPLSTPATTRSAPERRGFGEGLISGAITAGGAGLRGLIDTGAQALRKHVQHEWEEKHKEEKHQEVPSSPPAPPVRDAVEAGDKAALRDAPPVPGAGKDPLAGFALDSLPSNGPALTGFEAPALARLPAIADILRSVLQRALNNAARRRSSLDRVVQSVGERVRKVLSPRAGAAPPAADPPTVAVVWSLQAALQDVATATNLSETSLRAAAIDSARVRDAAAAVHEAALRDAPAVRAAGREALAAIATAAVAAPPQQPAAKLAVPSDFRPSDVRPCAPGNPDCPHVAVRANETTTLKPRGEVKPCVPGDPMCPYVPPLRKRSVTGTLVVQGNRTTTLKPRGEVKPCVPGDAMCPYLPPRHKHDARGTLVVQNKTTTLEPRGEVKPCMPGDALCPYLPPRHKHDARGTLVVQNKTTTLEPRGEVKPCVPGDALCPYLPPRHKHDARGTLVVQNKTTTLEPRGDIKPCVPGDAICPYLPPSRPDLTQDAPAVPSAEAATVEPRLASEGRA